jgi:hypothetical protein
MLPIWEVTTIAKYNIEGSGGGALSERLPQGDGNSVGTTQLGGPGFTSLKF